jgi:hypothetical protein
VPIMTVIVCISFEFEVYCLQSICGVPCTSPTPKIGESKGPFQSERSSQTHIGLKTDRTARDDVGSRYHGFIKRSILDVESVIRHVQKSIQECSTREAPP